MQLMLFGSVHKTDLSTFSMLLKAENYFGLYKRTYLRAYIATFLEEKWFFPGIKSFYMTHTWERWIHGIANGTGAYVNVPNPIWTWSKLKSTFKLFLITSSTLYWNIYGTDIFVKFMEEDTCWKLNTLMSTR